MKGPDSDRDRSPGAALPRFGWLAINEARSSRRCRDPYRGGARPCGQEREIPRRRRDPAAQRHHKAVGRMYCFWVTLNSAIQRASRKIEVGRSCRANTSALPKSFSRCPGGFHQHFAGRLMCPFRSCSVSENRHVRRALVRICLKTVGTARSSGTLRLQAGCGFTIPLVHDDAAGPETVRPRRAASAPASWHRGRCHGAQCFGAGGPAHWNSVGLIWDGGRHMCDACS